MKKVLFLLICLLPSVATWAGKTFYYTYDGQTLEYEIINETEQTCMVVELANAINEAVTIPRASIYDGELYLVVGIGDNAFRGCSFLTSVTIPNSVTSIGDYSFYGCRGLTSVAIPNSVTSIGEGVFWGCIGLEIINVDTGNQNYSSADGVLFNKDKTTLYCYPAGKKTIDYQIPNSVTSIRMAAFSWCSALTSVTIPNSVTSIGDNAFEYCRSLTSVTIPNSVTAIGSSAFEGCRSLTSVTIPNSVTSIGYQAFGYCSSLTSVTIPNSVTSIGNEAFGYCSSLTSVTIPNSVTSIGEWAFHGCI